MANGNASERARRWRPENVTTQAEVEKAIMETKAAIDEVRDDIEERMVAAAKAEGLYRRQYHTQRLLARDSPGGHGPGGRITNEEAEDLAMVAVTDEDSNDGVDLLTDRLIKDALASSARDTLRALDSQMKGLQTIAANIRAQS